MSPRKPMVPMHPQAIEFQLQIGRSQSCLIDFHHSSLDALRERMRSTAGQLRTDIDIANQLREEPDQ